MTLRESLEDFINRRLSILPDEVLPDMVVEREFTYLLPAIDIAIAKTLRKTRITAFSDDDLISFCYLRAHQVIKADQYDHERNPHSFFFVVFNNFVRDIVRAEKRQKRAELHRDVLDIPIEYRSSFDPELMESVM